MSRPHPSDTRLYIKGVRDQSGDRGAWAEWTRDGRRQAYALLLEPDGPFYFAGEHMSWIPGWQEGAVLSAHEAIVEIAKRVRK